MAEKLCDLQRKGGNTGGENVNCAAYNNRSTPANSRSVVLVEGVNTFPATSGNNIAFAIKADSFSSITIGNMSTNRRWNGFLKNGTGSTGDSTDTTISNASDYDIICLHGNASANSVTLTCVR